MPYYNGFPATYQPIYQPYTQVAPVQVQQQQNVAPVQQNGKIWVSGEAGAKAYLVAPNNTVDLWDSEQQCIYIKSADASGMPSMKILEYTIRDSAKNPSNSVSNLTEDKTLDYATKEEIRAVSEQITALRDRVDNLAKRRRREDDDE